MQSNRSYVPTTNGESGWNMEKVSVSETKAFEESPLRISVMGVPGAGKTTQSQILQGTLGTMHVSSGDLVRTYLTDKSTSDELAKGHLAPDELAVQKLVRDAIGSSNRYVLDGFPRMIDQIKSTGITIDAVIRLSVPVNVAIERLLSRGRPDDTKDVIESRLDVYNTTTLPVLSYFKTQNTPIIKIDGDQPRGKVWADIVAELHELAYKYPNS